MLALTVGASSAAPPDAKYSKGSKSALTSSNPWLPAAKNDDTTCDATVSYLFIAPQAELPLSPVWRKYFDGCPAGSYTVHVHAQTGSTVSDIPEAKLVHKPLKGELRFSYKMQQAMNLLYEAASAATAPNGCQPRWAQVLSDSCAPVSSCAATHEGLAKVRGVSQFEARSILQKKPKRKPGNWFPVTKGKEKDGYQWWRQSQWSALWMDHARALLQHEDENREAWEAVTRWPVDSHYAINLLYKMRLPFSAAKGTTAVAWEMSNRPLTAHEEAEKRQGHPVVFDCSDEVDARHMLTQAVTCGRFFARKFTPACVQLLSEWQQNASLSHATARGRALNAQVLLGEQLAQAQSCNQADLMPMLL
jgi:hypothetical protein